MTAVKKNRQTEQNTKLAPCEALRNSHVAYLQTRLRAILDSIMAEHKILLVEDSEALRLVLAEKLRDEKFEVLEGGGGEEGLKLADEHKPDVVITDIVMFPMDGLEMAKRIRELGMWGNEVYIIALTNQNNTEEEDRLKDLRLNAYLVKADTSLDDVVKHVKELFRTKKKKS
jgi:DNA-binding response OmpR family regulator